MHDRTTAFVVFSGFNLRAVVAFLRSLRRNSVQVLVVACDADDGILNTAYAADVCFVRPYRTLDREGMAEALNVVVTKGKGHRLVLAPSAEGINRFFLHNGDLLIERQICLPLVDASCYERISDKFAFGELCRTAGLQTPDEIADAGSCVLPFVAKPRRYDLQAPMAPILIKSEVQRERLLETTVREQWYFQKFVHGRSIYLLLHVSKSGDVLVFSQENLLQQPEGKSIVAAVVSDFHRSPEATRYVNLLRTLGFFGLIMIELRVDGENCTMIEANPRFWGPSQLMVDAMPFDLFDAFLRDNGVFEIHPKQELPKDRYFWFDGLLDRSSGGNEYAFFNYSASALISELPKWLEADVYRRSDTRTLFMHTR